MDRFDADFLEYLNRTFADKQRVVEPAGAESLSTAFRVLNLLQQANGEPTPLGKDTALLEQEQASAIFTYLDSLGEYNKKLFYSNLSTLLKKNSMRISDLEAALQISTGYLSRLMKADSDKKMSVDILWKIAKIFNVSVDDLLETELQPGMSNTDIVLTFLRKLRAKTLSGEIEWVNCGGKTRPTLVRMRNLEIVCGNGQRYNRGVCEEYGPYIVQDDIFSCSNAIDGTELLVVTYAGGSKVLCRDYIFMRKDLITRIASVSGHEQPSTLKTIAFSDSDVESDNVRKAGHELISAIRKQFADIRLTSDVKNILTDYLK